jgi:integrase
MSGCTTCATPSCRCSWSWACPPHVVQAIARHADVKITLKIYSHTNLDAMRQALGKLDGRLS